MPGGITMPMPMHNPTPMPMLMPTTSNNEQEIESLKELCANNNLGNHKVNEHSIDEGGKDSCIPPINSIKDEENNVE